MSDITNRRRRGELYPSEAQREILRLRAIDGELESTMMALDRFDRDDVELSITQAKAGVAEARKWIDDAITCIRVDHGLTLEDDAEE